MSAAVRGSKGLLTSVFCAFAALAPVAAAQAQETAQEPEALDPSLTASDEIVVTATGRAAAIQDVPIAITALNAEAIANANIQDLRQIEQIAPSFRTFTGQSNAASTTLFIRGIGTGGDNPGFEPAVGVFVDGVFRNRSSVAISELPEVERIEVLRGPQGTLFGRNTSAGALSVTTAAPEYDYRVFGNFQVGNFDFISTTLGVTGPLIEDVLAVRLEGNWQNRDGYINNLTPGERDINDRNRYFFRGQLLWDISSNASFRLIADTSETNEICCGAIIARPGDTAAAIDFVALANGTGQQGILGQTFSPTTGPSAFSTDLNARQAVTTPGRNFNEAIDEWGVSGELDWEVGGVNITSITSYREWVARRDQDIDFNDVDRAFRDDFIVGYDTFSQELRFQGEAGPLDWLVGGFFYQENARVTDTIRFGADAAAFVDAVTAGVDLASDGAADGLNIFGSLGTGPCGPNALGQAIVNCRLLSTALLGGALQSGITAGLAAGLSPSAAQAAAVAGVTPLIPTFNLFAETVAGTAPGLGQGQIADNFDTNTTAFAAFTHNEISLTDRLTLTLGARYNRENKQLDADLNAVSPTCDVLATPGFDQLTAGLIATPLNQLVTILCNPVVNTVSNGQFSDERTENEVTGTGSLAWKATDDLLLYAGYSRGYKSGGFNLDRSGFAVVPGNIDPSTGQAALPDTDQLEFDAEFVNAYEAGAKLTIPQLNTTINGALYLQRINGYQVNAFTGFNFQTFNVPTVDSRGFELDIASRIGDYFNFQGGVAYNDAVFDSEVAIGTLATGIDVFPAGTTLAFAPRWTLTGAANYKRPIGLGLYGQLYADVRWQSTYSVRTTGRFEPGSSALDVPARVPFPLGEDITDNDPFAQVNARVAIGDQDGAWSLEFFVRNLTDKFYNVGGFDAPEQDNVVVYPSQPRTWAMQLKFNF